MPENHSHSTYNAFQVHVIARRKRGLTLQSNYTFSKTLSDGEPFTDNRNPKIERRRPPWDINHALKTNFVYDLPLGNGRKLNYRPLSRLLEGWGINGILLWQTGRPFGIYSTRGRVNRSSYGGYSPQMAARASPYEGHAEAAFVVNEQAKARGLLDALDEAGVAVRHYAEPSLLKRERWLRQQINEKAHVRSQSASASSVAHVAGLSRQIEELSVRLWAVGSERFLDFVNHFVKLTGSK